VGQFLGLDEAVIKSLFFGDEVLMPQKLLAFFGQSKDAKMRVAVGLDLAIGN